jgi:hypothetical protein
LNYKASAVIARNPFLLTLFFKLIPLPLDNNTLCLQRLVLSPDEVQILIQAFVSYSSDHVSRNGRYVVMNDMMMMRCSDPLLHSRYRSSLSLSRYRSSSSRSLRSRWARHDDCVCVACAIDRRRERMCLFSRRDGRRGLGNGCVGGDRRGRYSMVLRRILDKKGENRRMDEHYRWRTCYDARQIPGDSVAAWIALTVY